MLLCTHSWALWWLSPVLISWIATVPLTLVYDSRRVGDLARRCGLLVTPEEYTPPPLTTRAHELAAALRDQLPRESWRAALTEPDAMAVHAAFLAHQAPLTPQEQDAAEAAAVNHRAGAALTDAEKTVLLHAPHLIRPTARTAPQAIVYPTVVPATMPEHQLTATR